MKIELELGWRGRRNCCRMRYYSQDFGQMARGFLLSGFGMWLCVMWRSK